MLEEVNGRSLLILPGVMNPRLFRTGAFLAHCLTAEPEVARCLKNDSAVLDMGAGSGILAVVAAARARRVVAVDVNPEAVRCARINVLLNRVEKTVDVRQGDLFAPVAGERFDLVLFNPPFFRGAPDQGFDTAWRATDTVERFAAQLAAHLNPSGCALVILSSHGEQEIFLRAFTACGFHYEIVARRDLINEILTVYRLSSVSGRADSHHV